RWQTECHPVSDSEPALLSFGVLAGCFGLRRDTDHTQAVLGAHTHLLRRVCALDVAAFAQSEGDGRHHADQKYDGAHLNGEYIFAVHEVAQGTRVVEVSTHLRLRTVATPQAGQHERQFRHHDQAYNRAHNHVGLEAPSQAFHAHIEHH